MLDLRRNRKGFVAIMDAMIFLTILSIVSVSVFSYASNIDEDQPLAKTVCDDLFTIKLMASDVYPTEDSQTFPIADLIAADLNTDRIGDSMDYVRDSLEGLIPPMHGYVLKLSYNGNSYELSRMGEDSESSEYGTFIEVAGGGLLEVELTIM